MKDRIMRWVDKYAIVVGWTVGIVVRLVVFALAVFAVVHLVGGWL